MPNLTPEQIKKLREKYGIKVKTDKEEAKSKVQERLERLRRLKKGAKPTEQPTGQPTGPTPDRTAQLEKTVFGKEKEEDEGFSLGGFAKDVARDITKPAVTMGVVRPLQAAESALKFAKDPTGDPDLSYNLPFFGEFDAPKTGMDVTEDVGRGVQTVALGVGAGAPAAAGKGFLKGSLKQGASAFKPGAISGGMFEAGGSFADRAGMGETALRTARGILGGGAAGFALGTAGGAIGRAIGKITSRSARKAEEKALLAAKNRANERIADLKMEAGKVVKDPAGKSALKQGFSRGEVALAKTGSKADKSAKAKMLKIREKGLDDPLYKAHNRSTDVAGDTILKQAKYVDKVKKDAAKELDQAAKGLKGETVNSTTPLTRFADDLQSAGVTTGKNNKLKFSKSEFRNSPSIQREISRVWDDALRTAKKGDAQQMHFLKKAIDNVVDYGAEGQGLKGNAHRILKGFRHEIDNMLDESFPSYNSANQKFAESANELAKFHSAIGSKFNLNEPMAEARVGTKMRGVLSNIQGRNKLMNTIDTMQSTAKKYGMKTDEDVVQQVAFADILEKHFGTEAPTSLLGQAARAASRAAGAAERARRGKFGLMEEGGRMVGSAVQATRGINQKNKIQALKAILGITDEKAPKTIFGRPAKPSEKGRVDLTPLKKTKKSTGKGLTAKRTGGKIKKEGIASKKTMQPKEKTIPPNRAQEARKFKSAEEFVEAQQVKGIDADVRNQAKFGLMEDQRLSRSPDLDFIFEANNIPKGAKEVTIYRAAPDDFRVGDFAGLNRQTAKINRRTSSDKIFSKKVPIDDLIQGTDQFEVIYVPRSQVFTKSQLTDFYNQAVKGKTAGKGVQKTNVRPKKETTNKGVLGTRR